MDYFRNVSLDNKFALEWFLSVFSGSSLYLKNMMGQALSRAIMFFLFSLNLFATRVT